MNNKKSILAGLIGLALLAGCSQAPDTADKHSGLALANMEHGLDNTQALMSTLTGLADELLSGVDAFAARPAVGGAA